MNVVLLGLQLSGDRISNPSSNDPSQCSHIKAVCKFWCLGLVAPGPRGMDQTQILEPGRLLESVKRTLTLVSPPVPVSAVMTLSGMFINVQTLKIAHITRNLSHKNE